MAEKDKAPLDPRSHSKPTLIVVTGRVGSGKTTLSTLLAQAVRCPLVSRDAIKEGLVHATGKSEDPNNEMALRTYETFFDTLNLLLGRQTTVIAEAAFQHRLWAPKLEKLRDIS